MLVEEYRELFEISFAELNKLKKLNAIVIGGWAAHFLTNERFKEWKNIDYIGSKDIDFAIMEKDLNEITKKLIMFDYIPINFRFYKIFDRETKKEISEEESKKQPIFKNFYLYVDLILDSPSEKNIVFFHDEIIKFAFENRFWINKDGFRILRPELLLLTKLRILKERNEEKRIKDILDCIFVSNFSNLDIDFFRQLREKFKVNKPNLDIARKILESNLLNIELSSLRFDSTETRGIKTTFLSLLE